MDGLIKNFATVTHMQQDLLPPETYRSVVDLINTIVTNKKFVNYKKAADAFLLHLTDYSDPHLTRYNDFYEEIIQHIYPIYSNMLASPLSLSDFKLQIASSISFFELFRRISLNNYLYNQVKREDGSVPSQASVTLTKEWGVTETDPNPVTITFGDNINNEIDFIKRGWNGLSTQPFSVIFNATDLSSTRSDSLLLFQTRYDAITTYKSTDTMVETTRLNMSSKDIRIIVEYSNKPVSTTTLLELGTTDNLFSLTLGADQKLNLLYNNANFLSLNTPSSSGRVMIVIDDLGYVSMETSYRGVPVSVSDRMNKIKTQSHDRLNIIAPYKSLYGSQFGIESVSVYIALEDAIGRLTAAIPPGYVVLTDRDGYILLDQNYNIAMYPA